MSPERSEILPTGSSEAAFETRDFYLACFLRWGRIPTSGLTRRRQAEGVRLPRLALTAVTSDRFLWRYGNGESRRLLRRQSRT